MHVNLVLRQNPGLLCFGLFSVTQQLQSYVLQRPGQANSQAPAPVQRQRVRLWLQLLPEEDILLWLKEKSLELLWS